MHTASTAAAIYLTLGGLVALSLLVGFAGGCWWKTGERPAPPPAQAAPDAPARHRRRRPSVSVAEQRLAHPHASDTRVLTKESS